jgi:hypothetical protein
MASSNSVPSRTAINALRGVLLTTSCSVILLAEERRQRLKIARAAYDNAKKLHTARVNRNSVALSESFARREAYPAELGDFSTTANAQNPIRRRKRNGPSSRTQLTSESIDSLPSSQPPPSPEFLQLETNEPRQRNWDEWDTARKELSRLSTFTPFAHNELFLRISTDDMPIAIKSKPKTHEKQVTTSQNQPSTLAADQSADLTEALNSNPHKASIATDAVQNSPVLKQDTKAGVLLRAVFMGEDTAAAARSSEQQSVPKEVSPGMDDAPHTTKMKPSQESLIQMDRLVAELKSPEADRTLLSQQQQSAIQLLGSSISSNTLESKLSLARGLSILESVIRSKEHENLPAILDALHPVCNEVCLLTVPAMDCLYGERDITGTKHLLNHLSESQVWKPEKTAFNLRNPWITRMLMHYWRKTQNFDEIKGIYGLLQDAGLFADGFPSVITQYAIRRRFAMIALDAGDDATARAEMATLRLLRPIATENDVKLRGRFIIRDAALGRWEAVWTQLEVLKGKRKGKGNSENYYQNALSWLTKIYCKNHSPAEIDTFVRDMISVYDMTLSQTLAFLVLDRHGRNRIIQSLIQWLQFCHDSGLEINQVFFNETVDKCCKYWNLTRVDVVHMLEGVKAFMPDIHDPHVAKYSVSGALNGLHKSLPGECSNGNNSGAVSQLPKTAGDSVTLFERTAFKCMNTWAQKNDWHQVYNIFKEALEKGIGFSSRCLRLAVIANINLEGPHSQVAAELVSKAHMNGHDVSGVLVPLLVARLESGDNVGSVLQAALDQGSHIHDSVYNKAARILLQKGLQEGAIRVCELAAQQNGKGELAYCQFNFASLVYAYTGQRRYIDLETLIRSFTSRSEWWQGSKECKESLKRAMKAVAQRVGRAPRTAMDLHKATLNNLNQGLEHVKKLRATVREDRQTLTQEVIGVFKEVDNVKDLEFDSLEEDDPLEVRIRNVKMTWEAPTADPRDLQQREESLSRPGSTRGKPEIQQKTGWDKSRPAEATNEQEELFVARQTLAGAFF